MKCLKKNHFVFLLRVGVIILIGSSNFGIKIIKIGFVEVFDLL